mgnify:CR=1 FL=1
MSNTRFTPTPVGSARNPPRPWLRQPVHPHACGERGAILTRRAICSGSPPRLWGARCRHRQSGYSHRFTPTPVGSARSAWARRAYCTVHPHACGERGRRDETFDEITGSPPRLWGAQDGAGLVNRNVRFTPTPVGSAEASFSLPASSTVHPHACGERLFLGRRAWPAGGSPPRLWGALAMEFGEECRIRFTPTPVGSAVVGQLPAPIPAVHPHACGERVVLCPSSSSLSGSPPRLWGAPVADGDGAGAQRFTPTPVGSALSTAPDATAQPVHPHACGERVIPSSTSRACTGSPPRLWGALCAWQSWPPNARFTPTPVGSALTVEYDDEAVTVHPHACGERDLHQSICERNHGSPPRLWGAPSKLAGGCVSPRFTPTPVGSATAFLTSHRDTAVHPHACGERVSVRQGSRQVIGSPPRLWGAPGHWSPAECPRRFTPTPVGSAFSTAGVTLPLTVHPHACGER